MALESVTPHLPPAALDWIFWVCMALCLGGDGCAHLLRGLVAHGASAAIHAHQVASGGQSVHVGLDVIHSQPAIKGALVGGQHLAWRHAWSASEGCTLYDVQHLLLDGLGLSGCGHGGVLRIRKKVVVTHSAIGPSPAD